MANKFKIQFKIFNSILKSNKAFSLIEVIVGTGLLAITATGFIAGYNELHKGMRSDSIKSKAEYRVAEIIENIRQKPTSQIIQYTDKPSLLLVKDSLKMAWSELVEMPAADCADCPGRYGYVITPVIPAMSDLYLVTIVFTHTEWGDIEKKYEFLVSK